MPTGTPSLSTLAGPRTWPGQATRRRKLARTGAARTVAMRVVVAAAVVLAVGAVHLRHRPATFCLLRQLTGVPCPFCGGTTAAVDLGHGRLVDALRASPLAVALVLGWPLRGVLPDTATPRRRSLLRVCVVLVLVGAELWQLHRFGFLAA